MYDATTEQGARAKLEDLINSNSRSIEETIQTVLTTVPEDRIIKSSALNFESNGHLTVVQNYDEKFKLHDHALHQMGEAAKIPQKFIDNFTNPEEQWRLEILAETLQRTYRGMPVKRYLQRSVKGEIRGFLSDKFRRIDARPLLDTFANTIRELGLVPYQGRYDDIRVGIKALIPQVHELRPGDWASVGVEWRNSDFGGVANALKLVLLRLICINGMVGWEALREVHLGQRLEDDIEWSDKTYRLDTSRSKSMLKDALSTCLGDTKVEELLGQTRKAAETEVGWGAIAKRLRSSLSKKELEAARMAFEGPDVVNLPPGKTLWRASNALSWMVHGTDNVENKAKLERLAGQLVEAA